MNNQKSNTSPRRLFRSLQDRQLSGVCGGIGEYFMIDSSLIRLGWIIFTVLSGVIPGIIAYIIAAIVIPYAPEDPSL